jgi:phospholipid N-methyltransferase
MMNHAKFLRQFILRPTMVGAIAPSSRALAKEMLVTIDFGPKARVCEYGPGTGVFTEAILARLDPGATFFAIERSDVLVAALRGRFPALKLHEGSAHEVERFAAAEGAEHLDSIVSGLPWAAFPESLQIQILEATVRALRPGGQMATFAYSVGLYTRAGRRFHALLPRYFSQITRSRLVLANLPPAYVFRCVK